MHFVHTNKHGCKTDITLVDTNLTFSKIVDSQLATINYTIKEKTTVAQFQQILANATGFDDEIFLMMSNHMPRDEEHIDV